MSNVAKSFDFFLATDLNFYIIILIVNKINKIIFRSICN